MTLYTPITSQQFLRSLEYVEETTPGTFPTNPTMLWGGVNVQWDDTPDMGVIELGNLSSEDLKYALKGADTYKVSLNYTPQTSTLMKYLVNSQGGGSGSIDKYLSLLMSPKIGATPTQQYLQVVGCKPTSGSIKLAYKKETVFDISFEAKQRLAYTTTDPVASGTHAADPGTNPWLFTDPGAAGIVWNSIAYDLTDLTVNVNRGLKDVGILGQSFRQYLAPTTRMITGDFTVMLEDTTLFNTDLLTVAQVTFTIPIKSGTSTLTLSNAYLKKLGNSFRIKDIQYEKWSFGALTASLT